MTRRVSMCLAVGWLALPVCLPGCTGQSSATAEPASEASTPERRERAAQRVRVAEVRSGEVGGLSEVAGVTHAFRTATVSAEVAGRVMARHVEPGDRVEAGGPLVTVDDGLLVIAVDEAQAMLKAREVDLEETRKELARGDELRREGTLSAGQHDTLRFATLRAESAWATANAKLQRARHSLDDAQVRAPFDGTVEQIDVHVGDYLAPGSPVATVADIERIRLRAGVIAAEAADLRPGLAAIVTIPALGGLELEADIHSVGRLADTRSGTYAVELWLDNRDEQLRGGMVGQLRLAAPEGAVGAVVPRAALLRRGGALSVFVVEPDGDGLRARSRGVRLGRQSGERVEILEGPQVGERVVVDGLFALTDGAPVYIDAALTSSKAPGSEAPAWND